MHTASSAFATVQPLEPRRLCALPSGKQIGKPVFSIDEATQGVNQAKQVIVGPDGSDYVGGNRVIARFLPNGRAGFAHHPDLVLRGTFVQMAIDADSRLYVLTLDGTQTHLRRYVAGLLDTTFGTSGDLLVSGDARFVPAALVRATDGRFFVGGTELTQSGGGAALRILALNADGSANTAFAGGSVNLSLGAPSAAFPNEVDAVAGMSLQDSGQLLVGGGTINQAPQQPSDPDASVIDGGQFVVLRLRDNGQLDASFGNGGLSRAPYHASVPFSRQSGRASELPDLFSVRADGSSLIAYGNIGVIAGFTPGGTVAFNHAVASDTLRQSQGYGAITGILALPDGRAVLVGEPALSTSPDGIQSEYPVAVTPVSADGTVGDSTIGPNQYIGYYGGSISEGDGIDSEGDATLTLAPDGRLLIASTEGYNFNDFTLARYSAGRASDPPPGTFANGTVNSVAVAIDNEIHVAYYDAMTHHLMYAHRTFDGLWTRPMTIDADEGAGQYLSLALDGDGQPSVAYYDAASHSLKFAISRDHGRHFAVQTIDASGDVGEYVSLRYFDNGQLNVAYYDKTDGDLRLADRNVHGRWTITTVDAAGDVGQSLALTANSKSEPVIAYVDNTRGQIRLAQQTARNAWTFTTVARTPGGARSLSINYYLNDLPAITFYALGAGELEDGVYRANLGRFAVHSVAAGIGDVSAQPSDVRPFADSSDPPIVAYDRRHNRLVVIDDPLGSRTTHTLIALGGDDASIDVPQVYGVSVPLVAFVQGDDLLVRQLTLLQAFER